MPDIEGDGLHNMITTAWNARSSPAEWAASVFDWNKTGGYSPKKLSSTLCDLLLNQILIGPSPSPLLVTYMQYGMITRLIHPLDFFTRLHYSISPSRPAQLNSFLTLLIAPFIQHIRAFDEKTGDELCDPIWKDDHEQSYADIAHELARAYVLMSTLLAEGVEYGASKNAVKPVSKNENPTSPLTALFSSPTSPPAPSTSSSQLLKMEAKGMVATNVQLCVDILTEILTTARTKAFILMSRYAHTELWDNLMAILRKVCTYTALERLADAYKGLLRHHASSLPWLSRSDPEGLGLPWMALMLAVEFETKGKIMYSSEDAFARFEMLRCVRGYSYVDFYVELWCAALRTLQRKEYGSEEWLRCKDFLLVKVPLLLCKWKQVITQGVNPITQPTASDSSSSASTPSPPASARSSPPTQPIYDHTTPLVSMNTQYNDVEISIFCTSQFPQLVAKQSKNDDAFDPVEAIARSCIVRGLVSAENIKQLMPHITISLPHASATAISIAALVKCEVPNTEEDVNELKRLISPELRLNESTAQVMSSICTILCKNTDIQEHMVMLVLYVLDKDSNLDLALVLNLIAQLSRPDVLTVLKAHGRMPQMIAYLVQYCDEWGYPPPESHISHHRFGTAFCLLVKALEYHNLRSHSYNQIVLHFVLRSIATRKLGSFITPTHSNALHPRSHAQPETPFPFWDWYRNYLHIHSTHTPFCTTHLPDKEGAARHQIDPLHKLAERVLDVLRGPSPRERLQVLLQSTTPWQLISSMPYLCSILYQGCIQGLQVSDFTQIITPLSQEVPHCMSEIAFWMVDELARGTRAADEARYEVPLPLTLLSAIISVPMPTIVFDTMKIMICPILLSLRPRSEATINTIIAKMDWQPPRFEAFNIDSIHAAKFMEEVFQKVLDVAYPSSDLLQAAFGSMFLLSAKLGAAHFVDLVCKEFMNVMVRQSGSGHSSVHALRTAELSGAIIGACGSSLGLRILYTEKIPIFLHWVKNGFQSELLAYFCMTAGVFCGVFHVSAFVSNLEDCFGLEASFAMQHISQIVSDIIDQQQRQITPVLTFATTFLTLLLALPRTKLVSLGKDLVHRMAIKLKQLGRPDLVVSLLDLADAHDRAFAAHLFTTVV
eukprot:Phypoly_transcript_01112.p1 GENE.Phypoly_transcript_01112~~Phypoly_transcript_01112.p1  ORF type:complete len:1117 (+),score=184.18 Phypoly_transcript_01112:94-3444(+)